MGGEFGGVGVWERMDSCICKTESLHCPSDTITTLLIGYTPIGNKKFFLKERGLFTMSRVSVEGVYGTPSEGSA